MVIESDEQIQLEKTIKTQAHSFLKEFNDNLPESMELEYEGFYRRGFFVTKKRYAVIEDGTIIAKGLELVRRDWAPIAKDTQQGILKAILEYGDVNQALEVIGKSLKKLRTGKVDMKDLIIHTQITRNLSNYKQIGPHVVAAKKMEEHGMKIEKGTIIQYVITKGKGSISSRAVPYDYIHEEKYDIDYYVNNQVLPAVERIMISLGYDKERLSQLGSKEKQHTLDDFF